ncbi:MAG TPA: YtcA family lipoprotein [Candidatus Binatia bacterium]|nr:YtcA family lipoprotein [Candidatus Binatia bacterium]
MFGLNVRLPLRVAIAAGAVLVGSAGCTGAPAHDILGSFFPSWMICALLGLALAIVVRQILVARGVDEAVPAPAVVYLVMAVAFAFAIWLLWLS